MKIKILTVFCAVLLTGCQTSGSSGNKMDRADTQSSVCVTHGHVKDGQRARVMVAWQNVENTERGEAFLFSGGYRGNFNFRFPYAGVICHGGFSLVSEAWHMTCYRNQRQFDYVEGSISENPVRCSFKAVAEDKNGNPIKMIIN